MLRLQHDMLEYESIFKFNNSIIFCVAMSMYQGLRNCKCVRRYDEKVFDGVIVCYTFHVLGVTQGNSLV